MRRAAGTNNSWATEAPSGTKDALTGKSADAISWIKTAGPLAVQKLAIGEEDNTSIGEGRQERERAIQG